MKKKLGLVSAVILAATILIPDSASAHVGVQTRGNSLVAGASSRIYLSLGHGCTYKGVQYGTRIFQTEVPAAAGKPTPEFHQGFKATVVASTQVDAKNTPVYYTVTWTAKSSYWTIDPNSFYDFGIKVTWNATPQKIFFKTTQTCFIPTENGQVKAYLQWNIVDGSTKAATVDTEFGPAPAVTTVAS